MNLLTKFHEDRTVNVASRVLTRFYYSHIKKNAPPRWWPYIIGMNLLTEFHEDRTINVASRVKNAPPLISHVFQAKKNLLTKLYEDRKINVASRVLTRNKKYIVWIQLLTKFVRKLYTPFSSKWGHKNAPPPGGHVFQPTGIIFELVQDIIGMNLLIKFHEDWTINVASSVLTRFYYSHIIYYSHIRQNAPPLGSHVFQAKFHDNRTINVASRVLTRKNAPPSGGNVFQPTGIIF
ncbi:hypothetical protein DPMN_123478 [Dreissena polymorpha]|uniref:Uncharacterized protein n=1 Tax=Dreissena polymorpha TaxID=45954 RepID=A0A9D4GUI1_DREPO|nr:hypothetical protein DPMN_123478 [Dreissena polymorpha]